RYLGEKRGCNCLAGLSASGRYCRKSQRMRIVELEIEMKESRQVNFLNQDCTFGTDLGSSRLAGPAKNPFSAVSARPRPPAMSARGPPPAERTRGRPAV